MQTYWEIQMQTCLALELLGISLPVNQRLPLFQMRMRLLREFKDHPDQTLVSDTVFMLDELSRLRQLGMESKHNGTHYI